MDTLIKYIYVPNVLFFLLTYFKVNLYTKI